MAQAVADEVMTSLLLDPLDELTSRLLRISMQGDLDLETALAARELDAWSLLHHIPDFIYVKDRRSRFVFANAAAGRSSKFHAGSEMIGKTDFDILDHQTARELFAIEQEIMSTGIAVERREECVRLPDGRLLWLISSKMPLRNGDGQIVGLIGISVDITERKRQDERRHGHARLLEMIARGRPLQAVLDALVQTVEDELEDVTASVLLYDEATERLRNGATTRLPPAYVELVEGIRIGPKVGSCGTAAWRREPVVVTDVMSDPLWEDFRDIARLFSLGGCWSTPILGPDGRVLGTFALYFAAGRQPTDLERELTAMATDIAGIAIERARFEERIQHMAHHDPLTGLPNRTLFWAQFSRALHEANRAGRTVTVAYIDLDNFKQINDTLGHAAGDEVLKTVSSRMARCTSAHDLLVRLGGDEFAIVFSNSHQDDRHVMRQLQELRSAVACPVVVDGRSIVATCSMGVAFFPKDGETPEDLLAHADRAMYEAKDEGRDRVRISGREGI